MTAPAQWSGLRAMHGSAAGGRSGQAWNSGVYRADVVAGGPLLEAQLDFIARSAADDVVAHQS
jgi:hypothetical protein